MAKRIKREQDVWLNFSYSKLRTLFNCPFQYWHQYILQTPKPIPSILAVGSALHYLAHLFNKVNYKSVDSYVKAWKGFWMGVIDPQNSKPHGPGSFRERPLAIAWRSEAEARSWYGQGAEILAEYYRRQKELRDNCGAGVIIARLSERRIKFAWRGFRLFGIFDRVDEYPQDVCVIDLKMGKDDPVVVASSLQPLFYQVGYEEAVRHQVMAGKPWRHFATENLFTGEQQIVPPAGAVRLQEFSDLLTEASNYIRYILGPQAPLKFEPVHLHPEGVRARSFFPRLPRGLHCRYCPYTAECQQWETSQELPPREIYLNSLAQTMSQPTCRQALLPF